MIYAKIIAVEVISTGSARTGHGLRYLQSGTSKTHIHEKLHVTRARAFSSTMNHFLHANHARLLGMSDRHQKKAATNR